MFRTVPLSIIRIFSLCTQQWYMSYRFADSLRAGSGSILILLASCQHILYDIHGIPLLCIQWKTPDDGQRNCPKYVDVHSMNKFEKLVHLVGFIIRKFIMMHGNMNVSLSLLFYLNVYCNTWSFLCTYFLIQPYVVLTRITPKRVADNKVTCSTSNYL
jgi:hypothetical protein